MKIGRDIFKKPSFYSYIIFNLACLSMLIYSLVSLFLTSKKESIFLIHLLQVIFSIVCFLALLLFVSVLIVKKIKISELLSIFYMLVIFLIFGIYPCFDLYQSTVAISVLSTIVGMFFATLSITIYYIFEKDSNGQVHAKKSFMLTFMILFSVVCSLIFTFILYYILKSSGYVVFKTIGKLFANIGYSIIGIVFVALLIWISLIREKKLINLCLMKQIKD